MALIEFVLGLVVGAILGAGGVLIYIQHKMKSQLGAFESEMEDMMNMTEEMEDMMAGGAGEVEDLDIDEVKEDDKED
jgi:hypothetical protein